MGDDWTYMTLADREAHRKFDAFCDALSESVPARMARARLDVSVNHPSHYLNLAHRKAQPPDLYVDPLPPAVRHVARLQQPDGQWAFDDRLAAALGAAGAVPEPPITSSRGRWATALAVAMLRRYPQYFAELEPVVSRGLRWISAELLSTARDALPPPDLTYEPDAQLVRSGRWHEAEQSVFDDLGYVGFVAREEDQERHREWHEPPSPLSEAEITRLVDEARPVPIGEMSADELMQAGTPLKEAMAEREARRRQAAKRARRRRQDDGLRTLLGREHGKAWSDKRDALAPGDEVESCWRRVERFEAASRRDEWFPAVVVRVLDAGAAVDVRYTSGDGELVRRVPLAHVCRPPAVLRRRRQERLQRFEQQWTEPKTLRAERRRLHPFSSAAEYAQRRPGWDGSTTREKEKKKKKKAERPKPLLRSSSNTLYGQTPPSTTSSSTSGPRVRRQAQLMTRAQRGQTPDTQQAEARVVGLVGDYEAALRALKKELKHASGTFRAAAVYGDRLHAFDKLTEMLGDAQALTCSLVEAVAAWRRSAAEAGELQRLAFMWGGKNVLLSLLPGLDFLAESPQLREWYGVDYPWAGNPLCMYRPMAQRPRTPLPVKTHVTLVNGDPVELEDPLDAEEKRQEAARVQADIDALSDGAEWWPGRQRGEEHWARIRSAERALLLEGGQLG